MAGDIDLPTPAAMAAERRDRVERRSRPTPRFSRYALWGGRRRGPRRAEEVEGTYVDVYGVGWWLLILWVAVMNCLDTYFTLLHLQAGGAEINPVADELLRTSTGKIRKNVVRETHAGHYEPL